MPPGSNIGEPIAVWPPFPLGVEMCIAVYAAQPEDRIAISFALDRICRTQDGGTQVTLDLLISNVGSTDIGRLRFAYPNALVRVDKAAKSDDQSTAAAIAQLRSQQLGHVSLATERLTNIDDASNWI